ncbi:DEAD/DEAH box helicase, partial [Streptococcus pseudopneumoniae]|uniref:DEAD/DEAH box helicase n=1 Tax=Streptococcus pseudopneumoniae TaxID=257758 RepID=UPI0033157564
LYGERNNEMEYFLNGEARHMVFVTALSEGWDHPPIDALCLLRPTRSPVLYVQLAGRVLRPYDGKVDSLILDYGNVVKNLGPLDNPRIPKKGER